MKWAREFVKNMNDGAMQVVIRIVVITSPESDSGRMTVEKSEIL